MKIRLCKRVFGRLAVLGALTLLLLPSSVQGAPILAGVASASCPTGAADGGIVPTTTASCGFAAVGDPLLGPLAFNGEFTADQDVALFQFVLGTSAFVSASAADNEGSILFDPFIGLFHAATGASVRYFDPDLGDDTDARNDDIDPDNGNFNALIPAIQLEAGSYILALLQTGNTFSGGPDGIDNLREGFAWDSADPGSLPQRCGITGSCAFTVGLTATTPSASVPEPGTLSLLVVGAAAAAAARRRTNRNA